MIFITLDLVLYTALALEAIKSLLRCRGHLAWRPFVCFLLLVYPNYYGFWSIFTYINDRNWNLIDNQLFFCVSEAVAAALCVFLCDKRRRNVAPASNVVAGISGAHIVLALIDQLRGGYFFVAPNSFQRIRDVFLLLPEVLVMVFLTRRTRIDVLIKTVAILVPLSLVYFAILPIRLFMSYHAGMMQPV